MPWRARILVIGGFLYAVINFGSVANTNESAGAMQRDGRYFLHQHGQVIREISVEQYRTHKTLDAQAFSGHWMFFYLLPGLYFSYADDGHVERKRDAMTVLT